MINGGMKKKYFREVQEHITPITQIEKFKSYLPSQV